MTNSSSLILLLDKLYNLCLTGGYGLTSAYVLADKHKTRYLFSSDNLDKLIKQEANKAATTGFITGGGGLISLPVTLPIGVVGSLFIQIRLVAAIAILQEHDVRDKRIKALIYFSLCVMLGKAELQRFCLNTLMKQPNEIIVQLSQRITQQLAISLSSKHSVKLIKIIPFVGAAAGAVFDRIITYKMGLFAKYQFSFSH